MSDNRRWSTDRRTFLKTTGAAGAVGLAGFAGCLGGEAADVELVLNPAEGAIDVGTQYGPLVGHIEDEVDVSINIRETGGYTETIEALRNDQAELSGVSPGAIPATEGEDIMDVIGMRVAFGSEVYFSTIHTYPNDDPPVESLEEIADLDNPEINCADVLSVSGTLTPLTMMAEAGLDVGEAPNTENPPDFQINFSDHQTSRTQMVDRDEIVAACNGAFQSAPWISQEQFEEMSDAFVENSSEYDGAGERIGEEHGELKLLAVSDPIPRAPMVSRSNWDDDIREDIEDAMLNAPDSAFEHDTEDLAEELGIDPAILDKDEDELTDQEQEDLNRLEDHELWFSGIVEANREDYAPIQEIFDQLAVEFEDLQ